MRGVYVAPLNRQGAAREMTARSPRQVRDPIVRNVWTGHTATSTHADVTVTVLGNGALLLRVTRH
jgi:hypothetical protein